MSEIDKLFKNNKEAFDRLMPTDKTWSAIRETLVSNENILKENKKKKPFFHFKLAATIALVVSLSVAVFSLVQQRAYFDIDHISLVSPEGQLVPLDPTINKYTLVQFWESGNVLCSEDNCYYYLPAYEKYKNLGFEIYAISLDDDKNDWILGIEENQLPWIHVSDLQGWGSPICIECNIDKIPASFLLDQKGKIIARDLNAADLDHMLNQLLAQNLK